MAKGYLVLACIAGVGLSSYGTASLAKHPCLYLHKLCKGTNYHVMSISEKMCGSDTPGWEW